MSSEIRKAYGAYIATLEARVAELEAALGGLFEVGPEEPIMEDPGAHRYSFWFCGGTIRKGHAEDCPWQAALALRGRPADGGERG